MNTLGTHSSLLLTARRYSAHFPRTLAILLLLGASRSTTFKLAHRLGEHNEDTTLYR
jgi:hypothetical protein